MSRFISMLAVALCVALFCTSMANAADTVKGKVVSVGDGKITVIEKDNDETEFQVAESAKITRNGKKASLSDLEEGDAVEVTTVKKSSKAVVTAIIARSQE